MSCACHWVGRQAMLLLASFVMEDIVCFLVMCLFFHAWWQKGLDGLYDGDRHGKGTPFALLMAKTVCTWDQYFKLASWFPWLCRVRWPSLYQKFKQRFPVSWNFWSWRNCCLWVSSVDCSRNHFWKASLDPTFFVPYNCLAKIQFSMQSSFHFNQQTWPLSAAIKA